MRDCAEPSRLPRAETYFGLEGLKQLRRDWQNLFARIPHPGFHLTWHYHEALLRYGATHSREVIFICLREESGDPLAIVALQPKQRRIARIPFLAWQQPDDPDRPSMDFLAAPGADAKAVRTALVLELKKIRPDIDLLAADRVREGSAAWRIASVGNPTFRAVEFRPAHYLLTNPSAESVMAAVGKGFRSDLRRRARKLQRAGLVEYRVHRDPEDINNAFDKFVALEAAGWKGNNPKGKAIALSPKVHRKFSGVIELLSVSGACEIHSLWAGDECIAALIGFLGGGEMYSFKTTYNEAWKNVSPSQLLLEHVVRHCCDEATIDTINFGWESKRIKPWNPLSCGLWAVYSGLGGWRSLFAAKLLTLRGADNASTVPEFTAD